MFALSHLFTSSGPQSDLKALLVRMRQRMYPETMPVLASVLAGRHVCTKGHPARWWKELVWTALKQVLLETPTDLCDPFSREILADIRNWIEQSGFLDGKTPAVSPRESQPFRANLGPEWLARYIGRLLNEWLSAEVARLLVDESEFATLPDVGIPVLAAGRALERLLVRGAPFAGNFGDVSPTRAPFPTLHLRCGGGDVARRCIGAPRPHCCPTVPAVTRHAAGRSGGFFLFRRILPKPCGIVFSFVRCREREEIHVPLTASQALEIPKSAPLRIASIILTMDGRCWEAENLQSGEQHLVIYRPGKRLRIDYSAEHAKLKVPWPDTQLRWSGGVHISRDSFEIFGLEWASRQLGAGRRPQLAKPGLLPGTADCTGSAGVGPVPAVAPRRRRYGMGRARKCAHGFDCTEEPRAGRTATPLRVHTARTRHTRARGIDEGPLSKTRDNRHPAESYPLSSGGSLRLVRPGPMGNPSFDLFAQPSSKGTMTLLCWSF